MELSGNSGAGGDKSLIYASHTMYLGIFNLTIVWHLNTYVYISTGLFLHCFEIISKINGSFWGMCRMAHCLLCFFFFFMVKVIISTSFPFPNC